MNISKCCGSIPWNDTDICAECKEHASFINHIEYNTQILRRTNMNERILKMIQKRLEVGERKYGHENVENDGRNFTTEALEEALDCAVYLAAKLIEIQTRNGIAEDAHAGVEELARMENNEPVT
jgi:hypothetical protein